MTDKRRGLGRGLSDMGLEELLTDFNQTTIDVPLAERQPSSHQQFKELAVEQLKPGRYQPRKTIKEQPLQELAQSIKAQGVIQPILVRPLIAGGYEIVAGERRWRAAKLAGLTKIPVIVRQLSDSATMALALIENVQRQDLNPYEQAMALQRLADEFDMTHQAIADAVGKSRAAVTNLLRLQRLDTSVRALLQNDQLEMGHARALLSLESTQQRQLAQQIIARGLSVRETEQRARQLNDQPSNPTANTKAMDPDIQRLQNELSDQLSASVKIDHKSSGKGRLIIQYYSLEELQGILQKISKE